MAYVEGNQHTGNRLAAEQKIDVNPELQWLRPDNAPLVKLTTGGGAKGDLPIKKKMVTDTKFRVFEKTPHGVWSAINNGAGYTAGDTAMVMDQVESIPVGSVIQLWGFDLCHVTAKNTGTKTLTLTRSWGPTAAGIIPDNTPVYVVANNQEEFGAMAEKLMVQNRSRDNYTEIIQKPWGLSGTLENITSYIGKKGPELARESFLEFERLIERAFLMHEPYEDLTGGPTGNPIRSTGGMYYWTTTGGGQTQTISTTNTKALFNTFVRTGMGYGRRTKVLLCSYLWAEMLDAYKENKLIMKPREEIYNIEAMEYNSSQGRLLIIPDEEFVDSSYGTANTGLGGTAFMFDPENLWYHYVQNRDMAMYKDIDKSGADGKSHKYLAEVGLGLTLPELFSVSEGMSEYTV